MGSPIDSRYRHPDRPLSAGDRFRLPDSPVEVVAIGANARPVELRVSFDLPLDSRSLCWAAWSPDGFVPFTPPPVGQSVTLRSSSFSERLSFRYP
jgi:hypothetical protein